MCKKLSIVLVLIGCMAFNSLQAQQSGMMGEIKMFAGNYAPKGWAFCDGQLLAIAQNTTLYSVLGTTYGGNGVTTFGLPDMRGRVAMHDGRSPGTSSYQLGQMGGTETNTILVSNLPAHVHSVPASKLNLKDANTVVAEGNNSFLSTGNKPNTTVNTNISGAGQPVNNMQPFLTINYIICTVGSYPARD